MQIKHRIAVIEHYNSAAEKRVARRKRAVQRLRLERAFLLDQLAERMPKAEGEERNEAQADGQNYDDEEVEDITEPADNGLISMSNAVPETQYWDVSDALHGAVNTDDTPRWI